MFEKAVSQKTRKNLALLASSNFIKNFYLAGGTGLSLWFGHRLSLDLDFFSRKEFRPSVLAKQIDKLGDFSLKSKTLGTLHGIFNGTRVTFLYYPYPLVYKAQPFLDIKIAHWLDITCMKIDAVSTRGVKKDFVDIYFACQKRELKFILKVFAKKYKDIDFNRIHILKSLVYFENAEEQPLPKLLKKCSWKKIKDFFKGRPEIKDILKR